MLFYVVLTFTLFCDLISSQTVTKKKKTEMLLGNVYWERQIQVGRGSFMLFSSIIIIFVFSTNLLLITYVIIKNKIKQLKIKYTKKTMCQFGQHTHTFTQFYDRYKFLTDKIITPTQKYHIEVKIFIFLHYFNIAYCVCLYNKKLYFCFI